jgi:CTD small phosphatase-like protein 2
MLNLDLVEKHGEKYKELQMVEIPQSKKRLLVFDIDETMIHTIDERDHKAMRGQFKIKIRDGDRTEEISVNVRPYLMESLLELKPFYQIIAFTASERLYADAILDFLDPDRSIFEKRLYRFNCVQTPFGYVKDLRVIKNRCLKDILMIDNSCLSFAFNINNGVPILPFYDNTSDEELKHLTYYLNRLEES